MQNLLEKEVEQRRQTFQVLEIGMRDKNATLTTESGIEATPML